MCPEPLRLIEKRTVIVYVLDEDGSRLLVSSSCRQGLVKEHKSRQGPRQENVILTSLVSVVSNFNTSR